MSDKDLPAQHTEDNGFGAGTAGAGYAPKRSFGTKVKQHYRRFWWLHLIILIVVVLVITLPLVFVAFPNIAQHEVNKSTLNITSMSILNPKPESFDLEVTTVLHTTSKYHPQLDAFNGSLYLEDSDIAFAYLDVPAVKAHDGAESHTKQTVQIANMDQYIEYSKAVLKNDEYTMTLKGRGGLKEGGLPKTKVNYNKKITMKGLNSLSGFNVTAFNILTTNLPDGSNANGTVSIPNPSVMTIAMGNVTMSLSVDGTPIGISKLMDLVLKPGTNTLPLLATNNLTAVAPIVVEPKYKSGILPLHIVGNTSTYDGVALPYYEAALRSNELTVQLNVGAAIQEAGLASLLGIGNNTSS